MTHAEPSPLPLPFPLPATPTRTPSTAERHIQCLSESIGNRHAMQRLAQTLAKSHRQHPETLTQFLTLELRGRPEGFVRAYRDVLLTVGSLLPASVATMLDSLVARLGAWDDSRQGTREEGSLAEDVESEKESHDEKILATIVSLVRLTPSSSTFLLPAIEHHFPFHQRSLADHLPFVRNILRLANLLPTWKPRILELVLSKALVIDVELQNDSDLLRLFDAAEEAAAVTEGEDEALLMGLLGIDESEADKVPQLAEKRRRRRVKEGILKLDAILNLVFSHIHHSIFSDNPSSLPHPSSPLSSRSPLEGDERAKEAAEEMFSLMLAVFEKSILPTFKSRYLQFLPFYMASMCPTLADQFLGLLFRPLVRFCNGIDAGRHSQPTTSLLLSVAYIGSFVARARFLSLDLLKLAFELLVDLSAKLRARPLRAASLSPSILPVIVLQHVLYIFVWQHPRLRQCIGDDELMETFHLLLPDVDLLRHCNPRVVGEFIELAGEQLGLLGCTLLDQCRQSEARESEDGAPSHETLKRRNPLRSKYEELETYFPFDPILCLSLCQRYITSDMYQEQPPPPPPPPPPSSSTSLTELEDEDDDLSEEQHADGDVIEPSAHDHASSGHDEDEPSSSDHNPLRIDCSVDSRRPSL